MQRNEKMGVKQEIMRRETIISDICKVLNVLQVFLQRAMAKGLHRFVFIVFALFTALNGYAQTSDSLHRKIPKHDTLDIYKRIKKVAYKRKFSKFLYQVVFIDPSPLKYEKKPLSDAQKKKDPNLKYQGSIIRSVTILVMDPFGHSANDTSRTEINQLQKLGNRAHIVTQKRIVGNILLFGKNEKVELLKISESERLLREMRYITDARIYLTNAQRRSDSVDVLVIVHDKWTLEPTLSLGTTGGKIRLRDRNLGGLGQTYEQRYGYDINKGNSFRSNYFISNIRHSFISTNLFYTYTKDIQQAGAGFDRGFYSVLTKFAGGASFVKTWNEFRYFDTTLREIQAEKMDFYKTDFWLASAISLNIGKRINRPGSKLIGAVRYTDTRFQSRPSFSIDTARTNVNSSLQLVSIGYSLRKYYKDQFIYRFGANEDVPEGAVVQMIFGNSYKEGRGASNYAGVELSQGKHYKLGYLSGNFSVGTLYRQGEKSNTTINAGIYYFSNLSLERRWYIRQFVNLKFIKGFNKSPYERTTLRSDEMYGFNSGTITGTGKMLLNLETVMYAPYNLIGFRFAPVVFIGFGMLETDNLRLVKSPLYQSYSVGVLVRNESLLNSSFEITVGMYPNMPGYGYTVFKINPITSFTLKVRSFAISKPGVVSFD
jgi:hypothetical protein